MSTKVQKHSPPTKPFSKSVFWGFFLSRFVRSLLEEPEVVVIGAGQGPAGSIIHRMFVSAQRVRAKFKCFTS